jgi:hypothetical protein
MDAEGYPVSRSSQLRWRSPPRRMGRDCARNHEYLAHEGIDKALET